MALEFIEEHHEFTEPGIYSGKVTLKKTIKNQNATVVLRGIEPSFLDNDYDLLKFKVKIIDVIVRKEENAIEYKVDFDLRSKSKRGTSNVDVLIIADVVSD